MPTLVITLPFRVNYVIYDDKVFTEFKFYVELQLMSWGFFNNTGASAIGTYLNFHTANVTLLIRMR